MSSLFLSLLEVSMNFIDIFKGWAFEFISFLYCFSVFYFISLCLYLSFCFLLAYFALISFLKWKLNYWFETSIVFNALNFPLSIALAAVSHTFYIFISFHSKYFPIYPENSSLTHGLFSNMLFNFQVFGDFPVIFLLLISIFIPLRS